MHTFIQTTFARLRTPLGVRVLASYAAAITIAFIFAAVLATCGSADSAPPPRVQRPTPTPTPRQGPQALGNPTLADLGLTLAYARIDRQGVGTLVIEPPMGQPAVIAAAKGFFTGIAWSPDGEHLAVSFGPNQQQQDVYVLNADGSAMTRLTTDGHSKKPTWSPEGDRLAISVGADAKAPGPVSVIPATKPGAAAGLSFDALHDHPAWSPQGSAIAVSKGPGALAVVNPTTGREERVVQFLRDTDPVVSSLAYAQDGSALAGVIKTGSGLAVMVLADNLTFQHQVGAAVLGNAADPDWVHPSFTPDGSMLIAASAESGHILVFASAAGPSDEPMVDPQAMVSVLVEAPPGMKLGFPAVKPMPAGGGGNPPV